MRSRSLLLAYCFAWQTDKQRSLNKYTRKFKTKSDPRPSRPMHAQTVQSISRLLRFTSRHEERQTHAIRPGTTGNGAKLFSQKQISSTRPPCFSREKRMLFVPYADESVDQIPLIPIFCLLSPTRNHHLISSGRPLPACRILVQPTDQDQSRADESVALHAAKN